MAAFKFVISEPSTKKSFQKEVDQAKAISLVNKKIGDEFPGDILDLHGYSLQITGGTDKDGFPMHPSVKGSVKKRVLLNSPPGFHPKIKGQRKRKTVRGDSVSTDITQINVKVTKKGEKSLEELVPMKLKEKKDETKQEKLAEKKEEKHAEAKKEPEAKPATKSEAKEEKPAEQKEAKEVAEKPKEQKIEQPKEAKA
ncbi:MAG: 30S ribosomal protein S6e [Candidatus Aenigmarchaeota archaeon]|nr:30S ribosomal protein S6e [Candidatus Aenigmarchaeota archaeon]